MHLLPCARYERISAASQLSEIEYALKLVLCRILPAWGAPMLHVLLATASLLLPTTASSQPPPVPPPALRLYPLINDPLANTLAQRHWIRPAMYNTFNSTGGFGNTTHFAGHSLNSHLGGLGDVIAPTFPWLWQPNLTGALEDLMEQKVYLTDINQYVPGVACVQPQCGYGQYKPPRGLMDSVEKIMGNAYTGMDNGEQDGRYVGEFAGQQYRGSGGDSHPVRALSLAARGDELQRNFLQFSRHFQQLTDDEGSKMQSLNTVYYPHYFGKTGLYTSLSFENAQGLPNDQIANAFVRGAGKQYGTTWWAQTSIWNRWSYKDCYAPDACSDTGTSLSLMRRLAIAHILYDSVIVGFEGGEMIGTSLTPIGKIEKSASELVQEHGSLGVHLTHIAVLFDFFSGWAPPRHLYTADVYRVWGNLAFAPDDFWAHGVMRMLFPRYEDASYYHDERGFNTGTPFGDGMDALLTDVPSFVLQRYPVVIVATRLRAMRREIAAKLTRYILDGGILIMTAEASESLGLPILGAMVPSPPRGLGNPRKCFLAPRDIIPSIS
jgi:hypothetical protein